MVKKAMKKGIDNRDGGYCTERKLERSSENRRRFPGQDNKASKNDMINKVSWTIENDRKNEDQGHKQGTDHRNVEASNKGICNEWED